MWLLFAGLSGCLYTAVGLLQRYFLRRQNDAWAFSFYFSLVGALVSMPFAIAMPKVPHTAGPWLLAVLVGLLIVAHNLLIFTASGHLEASLIGALSKLRLVWVFILGIVLLGNHFSWQVLGGTLLAMAAGAIIVRKFRRPESVKGIAYVLVATVFNASLIITSKYLLKDFNAASLTFFVTFLPATMLNFLLMPHAAKRIRQLLNQGWPIIMLTCTFGAAANLALNQALSMHTASSVLVISEIFLILVLVGEHIILKEKEQAWVKIASVALAVAGGIMIQMYG